MRPLSITSRQAHQPPHKSHRTTTKLSLVVTIWQFNYQLIPL